MTKNSVVVSFYIRRGLTVLKLDKLFPTLLSALSDGKYIEVFLTEMTINNYS